MGDTTITRYLETGSTDPAWNLAFEETVLRERRQGDCFMLWQNEPVVVIGQNQNAEAEISRDFTQAHHIRVIRRCTGGGAVYHDLGNLNYSFFTDADRNRQEILDAMISPLVRALRDLGLDAHTSGRNDILVGERKISGTASRILNGRILHHGCLLFDVDLTMMAGALQVDPEKFRSRGIQSVRSRVTNLRTLLQEQGRDMDMAAFRAHLQASLAKQQQEDHLTPGELEQVRALKESKYDTWAWTFGSSPSSDLTVRGRLPGGTLEIRASLQEGRISHLEFRGDFLSMRPLDPLTEALKGCPLDRREVEAVLHRFPLEELFGSITAEEILDLLFSSPAGASGSPADLH